MPCSLLKEICEQLDREFACQSKQCHFYQLADPCEDQKRLDRHFCHPRGDSGNIEERIGNRRENQNGPATVFLHPGFDAIIHIRSLDDGLAAAAGQMTREYTERTSCPCCQANGKRTENGAYRINDCDTRSRE